jgi:hypothetical protein
MQRNSLKEECTMMLDSLLQNQKRDSHLWRNHLSRVLKRINNLKIKYKKYNKIKELWLKRVVINQEEEQKLWERKMKRVIYNRLILWSPHKIYKSNNKIYHILERVLWVESQVRNH